MQLQQYELVQTLKQQVSSYYELTKPKIVSLLVFSSLTATYVAIHTLGLPFSILQWIVAGVAITAGCAGCNALTCYIDRDIDAIMFRTRHRPIPTGRITPENALLFSLTLIGLSLLLAGTFNILSFAWMGLGVVDNVVVYSLVLKRRSWLNILLGGVSGGLPVMFGWSAVTPGIIGSYSLLSVMMAGLVFVWIPVHIWFLSVAYRSDYKTAGVPMLPVVIGKEAALRVIMVASIILFPFSLAVWSLGKFGLVYGTIAIVMGLANLLGSAYVLYKPTDTNAWRMFKLSSPYLFLLFIGMIFDVALR